MALLSLSSVLQEIDEYIAQAKDRSYETMMRFGKRGLNLAANAAVTAASKVGGDGDLYTLCCPDWISDLCRRVGPDEMQPGRFQDPLRARPASPLMRG